MPDSSPSLTPRSRLLLLLITLMLMAVMAAVIWEASAPNEAVLPAEPLAAAENPLPTLAAVIPTPVTTPSGTEPVLANSSIGLLPTPTLAAALQSVTTTETEVVTATDAPATPTATDVPPTEVPTEPPPTPTVPPSIDPPQHLSVNGIPYEAIVVMPDEVLRHAQEIYRTGQEMGRNPHAFSKVGDSTIEAPHFLIRYDTGPYELGQYASLQPVIDYFHEPFARDSIAVRIGMHSWTVTDPAWAEKDVCLPNESPLDCEIRVNNPSILLIRLGTNDVGVPEMFDTNIRYVVEDAIADGVIPVIGTKADRHEGSNINNEILRQIAADYQIPLWDFDAVANTLPGRGLDQDAAHMTTFFAHDFNDPTAFTRGHAMHNLTALMMLDAIWRDVMNGGS